MASGYPYTKPNEPQDWPHKPKQFDHLSSTVTVKPKTPAEIIQQLGTHLMNRGVGFTNHQLFFSELANQFAARPSFPPYDIIGQEEGKYEIRLAIAGFSKDEVEITFKEQVLTISGSKDPENEDKFFYKGIAGRDFKLSFPLAEYVSVTGAELADGILTVSLVRELPEELKPKVIEIK